MKLYIAHNYAAKEALISTVNYLTEQGIEVTSRWITQNQGLNQEQAAIEDLEDINRADAILLFTDQYSVSPGKGKYFELGYAYAKGKQCFLTGLGRSCVFYNLQQMIFIETPKGLLKYL